MLCRRREFWALPVLLALTATALLAGCAATHRTSGGGASRASDAAADSGEVAELRRENTRLKDDLAALRADRDQVLLLNNLLEEEVSWAHEDLRLVERQLVTYEDRLTGDHGKASAVSAAAEARMRYEKLRGASGALPDSTSKSVRLLINSADHMIRKAKYHAALFFAARANHTMNSAERRALLHGATCEVSSTVANLRLGPGQDFDVVERLARGATLTRLARADEWHRVRTASGTEGWIHASLVR